MSGGGIISRTQYYENSLTKSRSEDNPFVSDGDKDERPKLPQAAEPIARAKLAVKAKQVGATTGKNLLLILKTLIVQTGIVTKGGQRKPQVH